jgi:hypothetical protein
LIALVAVLCDDDPNFAAKRSCGAAVNAAARNQ